MSRSRGNCNNPLSLVLIIFTKNMYCDAMYSIHIQLFSISFFPLASIGLEINYWALKLHLRNIITGAIAIDLFQLFSSLNCPSHKVAIEVEKSLQRLIYSSLFLATKGTLTSPVTAGNYFHITVQHFKTVFRSICSNLCRLPWTLNFITKSHLRADWNS